MRITFADWEPRKECRLEDCRRHLAHATANARDSLIAKDHQASFESGFRGNVAQVFIKREFFARCDHQTVKACRRDLNIHTPFCRRSIEKGRGMYNLLG